MSDCRERLELIKQRISAAALRAGRDPSGITLIAVSKTQPAERVAELFAAGHHDFGESTLQDAMTKAPRFPPPAVWHFVGHLQTNKVKLIPGNFAWVHSVDSVRLAARISERAVAAENVVNVLLQVNIAEDPNKYGVFRDDVFDLVEQVLAAGMPGIRLKGLMTIGPRTDDHAQMQRSFAKMRELQFACRRRFGTKFFTELSMGMSGDFELAVAEGATMVRVGSGIFGARVTR